VGNHVVEGNALWPFGKNKNLPLIFIRQEAFRNCHEQVDGPNQYSDGHAHGGELMSKRYLQCAVVNPQQTIKESFEQCPQPAMLRLLRRLEKAAA
jgi:hypothetical protein